MKYPVVSSLRHKGKTIELDSAREIITLYGINGDPMGNLSWDFVIDQILAYRKPPASREARTEPRVTLAFRVKYKTPEGQQFESRAGGIGGGGLFIESQSPLAVGTKLSSGVLPTGARERMARRQRHRRLGLPQGGSIHVQSRDGRPIHRYRRRHPQSCARTGEIPAGSR